MRMVLEEFEAGEQFGAITRIARQLDVETESLHAWVRQAQVDKGKKPGITSEDKRRITELEREVRELRRANEILKAAAGFFARELDPRQGIAFVAAYGAMFGVGPVCKVLQVAPGTYYAARSRLLSARDQRDEQPSLHRRSTASSPAIQPPCLSVGWVDDCGPRHAAVAFAHDRGAQVLSTATVSSKRNMLLT